MSHDNVPRFNLRPDYSISRLLKGNWQLSPDHLRDGELKTKELIVEDLRQFVAAGFTTFDVADIYTGAEELIGLFNKACRKDINSGLLPEVQIHTKYVPDIDTLATVQLADAEKIIDRSLQRLQVERLDLVQFHWWDLAIDRYAEVALFLKALQEKGKIRYIGLTNFDQMAIRKMLDAGVEFVSAQVQYSVLDRRPAGAFARFCAENGIALLCYGSLAGGFLSERYMGLPDPEKNVREMANRSLTKYRLIIEEFGGWDIYQSALRELQEIGQPAGLNISEMAMLYTLSQKNVAGAIIGARNSEYLNSLQNLAGKMTMPIDWGNLQDILGHAKGPTGGIYHLERYNDGHRSIMKTGLNKGDASFDLAKPGADDI